MIRLMMRILERRLVDIFRYGRDDIYYFSASLKKIIITDYTPIPYSVVKEEEKIMTQNEKFLQAYKLLEGAVKTIGFDSVLLYEQHLEAKNSNDETLTRIRLCRQCRNFISHEAYEFFEASKEMIDFVSNLACQLDISKNPIKKYAIKQNITDDMKLQDALAIIAKRGGKTTPVFNKKGELVGCLNDRIVCVFLSKNNVTASTKVKVVMRNKGVSKIFKVIKDSTPMEKVQDCLDYLVKNDKGEIFGWY